MWSDAVRAKTQSFVRKRTLVFGCPGIHSRGVVDTTRLGPLHENTQRVIAADSAPRSSAQLSLAELNDWRQNNDERTAEAELAADCEEAVAAGRMPEPAESLMRRAGNGRPQTRTGGMTLTRSQSNA